LPIHTPKCQICLTGTIGIGKSNLARQIASSIFTSFQGLTTEKISQGKSTIGYRLCGPDGSSKIFAHRQFKTGPMLGPFRVRLRVFDNFGVTLLRQLQQRKDPVLVDELGIAEAEALRYQEEMQLLLRFPRQFIVVIQERALDFWRAQLPKHSLYHVITANRNTLAREIMAKHFLPAP
jgi:nucleoside-triphosphatase THEP1